MASVCRLCCLADTKLTNSVNDDVIINFLNFVPNLSLSDNHSMTSRVCQLCFGKAKICVDFVHKIQLSQKRFNTKARISVRPVQSLQKNQGGSSTQDALDKMKRISGINIKKVETRSDRFFNEDSDDSFSWPMGPEDFNFPQDVTTDNALTLPSSPPLPRTPVVQPFVAKKPDPKEVVTIDSSDEDYQPEAYSDSDDEPLQSVKRTAAAKRKRLANKDTDEDYSPAAKKPARFDGRFGAKEIYVNSPIKFTCAKCKNSFPNIEQLSSHMKSKECFNDSFQCTVCGKSFLKKDQLNKHMITHKEKVKVVCDQCGKEFKSSFDLDTHLESTHNRIVRKDCIYRCNKCSEVMQSHLDLVSHMKEHAKNADNVPKLCEICAKECPSKKSYQSHMQNHRKKRNHVCVVCGKAFFEKFQVTQHMHIHSGIKEYHCNFCDKSYAKRDSLRLHKKKAHPDEVAVKEAPEDEKEEAIEESP